MHESITKQDKNNINDPQKKHRHGTVSKNILLEGLNLFQKYGKMFNGSNSNSYSGLFTSITPIFLSMSVNIFNELI